KVDYLLKRYGNLYADLSADSGFNALARDTEYAKEFLERNSGKLLFGTDLLYESQEIRIIKFLEDINLSRKVYEHILHRNAEKLISLRL
ncbi:TPA: amidohydrolase, partial [Candidatus Bathyarchaeota archaeon]|nr:amidohydrolase [Candidatus Bathyarchaeota archaeon]